MAMKRISKRELFSTSVASTAISLMPNLASGHTAPVELKKTVHGGWTFRDLASDTWLPAKVPGTVHIDLLANGKIEDPFFGTHERDQQWIDKKDWEYATHLELDEMTLKHDHLDLVFAGLDTYADVYFNDVLLLQADNMFRTWTLDIKNQARLGKNALRIIFRSPISIGLMKLEALGYNPPATNDQSENGGLGEKKVSVFTRKAGYHYGWDWGPRFVTSGVWRPIYLRAWNSARILDFTILQESLTPALASLSAEFEVQADEAGAAAIVITSASDPTFKVHADITLVKGITRASVKFTLANPKLWWSNGLGEPHLYRFNAQIRFGKSSDHSQVTCGLRTLKVVQKPDDAGTSFYFELNGVPVFMKGANCIPNDSFLTRVTQTDYERVVKSAVDTHMNMLRVWGGGVYEDDAFYDLCDQNGILVWQDFMFACSMYPNDPHLLENIRAEAEDNVRRLRNHPCLAIWVGNNEIDGAWENDVSEGGWGWKQNYSQSQRDEMWAAYRAIFHEILPQTVAKLDPQRSYWPSSPLSSWDGKEVRHADLKAEKQSGDIHYWDVWWGQKPFSEYRTHIGRFMSEYGFQSFPELRTVKSYCHPSDFDIFSDVMKAHQRSSIGNGTIKNYMQRDYKVPKDFSQFLYVGQVLQAEGIKVAMEAHRARQGYCMGSLFWQINDCWPVASWSSIDYFGRWKAQQYFARKSFAPMLVSARLEDDLVSIYVVSDRLKEVEARLVISVIDFNGISIKTINQALIVKANAANLAFQTPARTLITDEQASKCMVRIQLMAGQEILCEDRLYLRPVKDLILPEATVHSKVRRLADGKFAIGLSANALVKNLCLSFDSLDGHFSDNYFDLLPNEAAIVTFTSSKTISHGKVESQLKLFHMAQVTV